MGKRQSFEEWIYPVFAVLSSVMYLVIIFGYRKSIDGDIIGNLIISNQGVSTGRIFPDNVFYSTGLPNIGDILIEQFFFRLGLSFYLTFFAARFVEMIFYFFMLYWFLKIFRLDHKFFLIWTVLLLPTYHFFYLIFVGGYYLWSLTSTLFLIYLINHCNAEKSKRHRNIYMLVLILFSVYKGLLGIKALMWVFFPMSLSLFIKGYWNKNKSNIIDGCSIIVPSIIGMIINEKMLLKKFGIISRSTLQYALLEDIPKRFSKVAVELLKAFGWQDEVHLISCGGIINAIIILAVLFMFYLLVFEIRQIKEIDEIDAIFFLFSILSMAIIIFILTFTKSDISANYLVPSCWAFILNCCIYYIKYYNNIEFRKNIYPVILCLLVFFYVFSWGNVYKLFVADQKMIAQENNAVLEVLKTKNLKYGYGTFWNSQLIAGSSNLEIESTNISILEKGFYYFTWLSPKRYYNKSYYEGKAFVILLENEKEGFDNVITNAGGIIPEKIFDDGYYIIYEIENSEMTNYIIG